MHAKKAAAMNMYTYMNEGGDLLVEEWLQYCRPCLESCITTKMSIAQAKQKYTSHINFKRNVERSAQGAKKVWKRVNGGTERDASMICAVSSGPCFDLMFFVHNDVYNPNEEPNEQDGDKEYFESILFRCTEDVFDMVEELASDEDCIASIAATTELIPRSMKSFKGDRPHSYAVKQYVLFPAIGSDKFVHVNVACSKTSAMKGSSQSTRRYTYKLELKAHFDPEIVREISDSFFPFRSKERAEADAGREDVSAYDRTQHVSFQDLTWFPVVEMDRANRDLALASSRHQRAKASPLHAMDIELLRQIVGLARGIRRMQSPTLINIIYGWIRDGAQTVKRYHAFRTGSIINAVPLVAAVLRCAYCNGIICTSRQ